MQKNQSLNCKMLFLSYLTWIALIFKEIIQEWALLGDWDISETSKCPWRHHNTESIKRSLPPGINSSSISFCNTCQDQLRFCLKITSETKEWQKITLKPIWWSIGWTSLKPISYLAKQLYSNISTKFWLFPSVQSVWYFPGSHGLYHMAALPLW
jgi:hypothetical protein